MYRCSECRRLQRPGVRSILRTVETRPKTYPRRSGANRFQKERKTIITDDKGGQGTEIVREVRVCPRCEAGAR